MSTDTASMEPDVLEAIDAIRPALQADGGDIVFNSIDEDGVVHVSLVGACGTCPVSTMTLKAGVERIIMDRVPGITAVESDDDRVTGRITQRVRAIGAPDVRSFDPDALVDRALAGDRGAIARLISLIETGGDAAVAAVARLYPRTGRAYTVGITGAPGAGKSTLTDRLVTCWRQTGAEVGVLAVDPTSPFSGGAILGDRVRMQDHATDPGVFIRSMATRGHLGGLGLLATPQAVRVLDAAGKPWIVVETVGVGQVEVEIADAADTTVVVVTPGWGDGVQAAKAGLLEIADVFVVNKADRAGAVDAVRDLVQMLELSGARAWTPPVLETVATHRRGIEELAAAVAAHRSHLEQDGELVPAHRALRDEIRAIVVARLVARAEDRCRGASFDVLVAAVAAQELDPYTAANRLLQDEPTSRRADRGSG